MKKLVEMVKIFILSIVLAVMMIPMMTCQAEYYSLPVTKLKDLVGTWYDVNGNVALTIESDYSINGCKIVALYYNDDYNNTFFGDGIYILRINEGNRIRDINLDFRGFAETNYWIKNGYPLKFYSSNGYHKIIIVDWKNALRNTKNPRHFESVGGIYLEMDKNQVISLYGQPSSSDNYSWKYNKEGFELRFAGNVVSHITIYSYGNRRFDWSGLSANDSKSTFMIKYNGIGGLSPSSIRIGYGEEIFFRNNSVTLAFTLYD